MKLKFQLKCEMGGVPVKKDIEIDFESPEFLWACFESFFDAGRIDEAFLGLERHPEMFKDLDEKWDNDSGL